VEDVIQDIEHAEPAAERDPDMLAEQARHDQADTLAQLMHDQFTNDALNCTESEPEAEMETVTLLAYTRYPDSFRAALTTGSALDPCRTALEAAGFDWSHDSGAKIFVRPWQYEDAMAALSRSEVALRPYHVIVSTSFEYNVEACLADIPSRDGARVKRRRVVGEFVLENPRQDAGNEPQRETWIEDTTGEAEVAFEIQRTFICETKRLRNAESVTQSTTEARRGGLNPRRVQPASSQSK